MRGLQRFISDELRRGMTAALERGEQVLIFLNRRGYASLPLCAECGQALKCRNCDVALTWHQDANAYCCHYCGYRCSATVSCPHCGAERIVPMGLGTQKVEAAVQALLPSARVARMDRDTTSRKNSVMRMLRELHRGTIDILIGTQMVVKGHDFPNITLVGIICADLSLNFPDFRAGERTFQLLAQAAGRAGRGHRPGRVILQTYNPQHFCIATAQAQDYKAFYDREIGFRRSLQYPPYARMIQLRLSGTDPEQTRRRALVIGDYLRAAQQRQGGRFGQVAVLGPIEAPLSRIARRYRWQLFLKSSAVPPLHALVRQMLGEAGGRLVKGRVRVVVDVDPFSTL
jgi:primosomal protein N' (replication factor Y)